MVYCCIITSFEVAIWRVEKTGTGRIVTRGISEYTWRIIPVGNYLDVVSNAAYLQATLLRVGDLLLTIVPWLLKIYQLGWSSK